MERSEPFRAPDTLYDDGIACYRMDTLVEFFYVFLWDLFKIVLILFLIENLLKRA